MQTNIIPQQAPSPQPSKNQLRKQICMYGFDAAQRKFSNTPKGKVSIEINTDTINANKQINNQQQKYDSLTSE